MGKIVVITICFCIISTPAWGDEPSTGSSRYWPQWRGPEATGVAPHGDPPVEWSESKNVRWKIEISGSGHASPIVWGDKVFVLTAVETDEGAESSDAAKEDLPEWRRHMGKQSTKVHKFVIYAISRQDGKILWERTVREGVPHAGVHKEGSWASNSPVTDGEHVYAYFGSYGLYCLDMEGNLVWDKDLGDMTTKMSFGEGNSPVLHDNAIVINWDHEEQSFIIALDKKTGEQLWKTERDETTSWATSVIAQHNGKSQVITSATKLVRSYDLATGELLWQCGGMTANVIPCPVIAGNMVYVMSGFSGNALLAINLDMASGDITDSEAIVWRYDGKATPYAPSPALYQSALYFLQHNKGILSCFDAKTGQPHYTNQKLEGIKDTFVSPVGAGEHIYVTGKNGITLVLKHGPKFEVLATNSLDDNFTASPAIVDKEMYLRGFKHLYCIAQD